MKCVARLVPGFITLLVLSLSAYGGAVTSISCSVTDNTPPTPQTQTQTSTSSCGVSYPSTEFLSSTGSVSAGAFFIDLQGAAYADLWSFGGYYGSNEASLNATASYTDTILTDGPVRSGYMVLDYQVFCDCSDVTGGANASASVEGYYSNYVSGSAPSCNSIYPCNTPFMIPVTLGVPVDISLQGNIVAGVDAYSGSFVTDITENLSISFLEADGTTPVGYADVSSTPEPAVAWLTGFGLAFVAIRKGLDAVKRKA